MNKLIPGAKFSTKASNEQAFREAVQTGKRAHHDVRIADNNWDRVAEGFRRHDPSKRKIAELLRQA